MRTMRNAVACLILGFGATVAGAQPQVTAIDISYPGELSSSARGINERGQIVGTTVDASHCPHPFVWTDGQATVIDAPDFRCGYVGAINDRGDVVGLFHLIGEYHAFLWRDGAITDLGTLPGDQLSVAWGINNRGQVVGASLNYATGWRAFLWDNGVMTDLGVGGYAYAINDRGQIVGASGAHAFLWDHGVTTDLGTLPGYDVSVAWGIDDRGRVVGYAARGANELRAFSWENGTMTDLGALSGGDDSAAYSISDGGSIAGTVHAGGATHPIVWRDGTTIDLGTLSGVFGFGSAINADGNVVGSTSGALPHAVLWQVRDR